jgi:outer membrane protein insertion porin family
MIHTPSPLRRFLPAGFLLALAASAAAQTRPAATAPAGIPAGGTAALEGLPIIRVEIVGNNRTPTQLILDQIRSQPGQPFSQALLDVDYKAVSALDRFVVVRTQVVPVEAEAGPAPRPFRGVVVRFIVEERSLITGVEISGNRAIKDDEIRHGLTARAGAAIDPFRLETDRRFILDLYHKKGYASASVEVDPDLLDKQGIVRYQIIEGPSTHIEHIVFEGNTALSDDYISWRIQTKTYFWIFRKGLVDEEQLRQDVSTIRDLYLKKGYLDARISYVLEYNEDKSRCTVRFVILEGMRYVIGTMSFHGNTVFSEAELLGTDPHIGPGNFAERDKLDALQKRIQDFYGQQGYIDAFSRAGVEVTPAFTDTPGIVDINVNITEGKPYTVGRIVVRGNATTQDRVIRRQIRIYPDQTFDMVLVRKSIERLKATGLFQDVKITPIPSSGNPEGVKDALVEVAEGTTGRWGFGAGVSTNVGLVGQFTLEQKNFDITNFPKSLDEFVRGQSFKGAGQYFRLLLEPGTEFQRYRLTFSEPYLFDTAYSFSNDIYYFTRARESWDERRLGDIVTLGRRFGDVWGLSLAFRAEQVTLTNMQDLFNDRVTQSHFPVVSPTGGIGSFSDTAQEILNEHGSHFLSSIKPAVVRDTTDSSNFPTTGTRTSLSLEQYGALGGDVDMSKIILSFNWYQTLYTDLFDRKTVLALRNEVGVIPFGDSPTYERFYLGGIGDLRGFKFRGVGPRSGPLQDPIGGDFSWVSTAEVNYPIYEDLLRGVVFIDVGTVEPDITIDTIRSDIGLGVRVNLPFLGGLPIALDFAYPVSKKSSDRTQFISVSLGIPF